MTQWKWTCGVYPGCEPAEQRCGTADTFDRDFEKAWLVFAANCTERDYQAWRDQRDWIARKYAEIDRSEKVGLR